MFLIILLSSSWQQILGKTYGLWCQNGVLVNDSFAFSKTKSCKNRDWSKIITEHYTKRWDNRFYYTNTLPKTHRSVPRKITISQSIVFWRCLWRRSMRNKYISIYLGRSTTCSCRANVLYNFISLRKKTMDTDED